VILHIGAALLAGTWPSIRDRLWPVVAWYADGLCMINTWGMFSRPPSKNEVRVVGVRADQSTVVLASSVSRRPGWLAGVLDVRLRKMQNRLAKEDARGEYGDVYLAYFCRQAAVREVRIELHAAPPAKETASVLMSRSCGAAEPRQQGAGSTRTRVDAE
jgi:hypothetical protein